MSELAKTLMVAFHLLAGDQSGDYLAQEVVVSIPTLRRYIADLRHMGCEIETVRSPAGYLYRLTNKRAVESRVCSWLELEMSRTLVI